MTTETKTELKDLLEYLDHDPNNAKLISDALDAAIHENDIETAKALVKRLQPLRPFTPRDNYNHGVCLLKEHDYEAAKRVFEKMYDNDETINTVKFNLAWCHAHLDNYAKALDFLDDDLLTALPQGAALKVQILHQLGRFDEALLTGKQLIREHPDHVELNAAVSVLAIDLEDIDLAKTTANKALNHPDAMTTLGTLALNSEDLETATTYFEKAAGFAQQNPRAQIGIGLCNLLGGNLQKGSASLDQGAQEFGTHVGSWIAAGWAYLLQNDLDTARERFQTALDIDDNFGEAHGSLSVIDALTGNIEAAQKRSTIALRLAPQSFAAKLTKVIIAEQNISSEAGQKLFEKALNQPLDGTGRTFASSIIKLGL